ncbi:MAG: phage minor head protein [Hydrogenoanaerobacterium sp.]
MGKKQTELDNYGLYYANQLDKLIGKRVGELAPTYRRLQKIATEHLKELYAEIEKTTDARVVSKRYRAKLQQMIIERITPELQILDIAQQAYVTEVLAGTLQYGYYTTAHSLEQVLGVAVNVSLLNRSGVLGVIANPWLPDNHTYSDRIRANTQLVANKAKDVVENIITKGLRYDEAAKQLSANIGESYNNATRIVRTEMTRANVLGTTYGMLENADLYEGKYWDATIDGNTAHRCAVNDKKMFDLDYDTSENPGIPGQRIPNHPHCRCMWKPKIEGLDPVKVKSYKTKDGREDFIKADNYDDYAKQLGLPSAKEMLESDNPRRYLRPGETLEDINKQVVRKEFNGHTIIASRAPWDKDVVTGDIKSGILKTEHLTLDTVNLQGMYGKKHATAMGGIVEHAPDSVRNTWVSFQNDIKSYDTKYRGSDAHYSRAKDGVKMSMAKSAKGSAYETPYQVAFHEFGHNIDYEMNMKYGNKERFKAISETYKDGLLGKSVKKETASYVSDYTDKQYKELRSMLTQTDVDNISNRAENAVRRSLITQAEKQGFIDRSLREVMENTAMTKISGDLKQELSLLERADISDIFEGATGAKIRLGVGHGASYWTNRDNGKEVFAEMFSATMCNSESLQQITRFFPESYKIFLEIMELVK